MWKLGVVAVVGNIISVVLDPVNTWISLIVSFVVFLVFMVRWFDVDFFGALIIIVVFLFVRFLFLPALIGGMVSLVVA